MSIGLLNRKALKLNVKVHLGRGDNNLFNNLNTGNGFYFKKDNKKQQKKSWMKFFFFIPIDPIQSAYVFITAVGFF